MRGLPLWDDVAVAPFDETRQELLAAASSARGHAGERCEPFREALQAVERKREEFKLVGGFPNLRQPFYTLLPSLSSIL